MDNYNKTIPTKKEVMDKGPHGKVGVYNNTDITNTDLNNTNTSSSSRELIKEFENNICQLKKTTKPKFQKIINENNKDMVLAVIDECTNTNVKSYLGFEVAFNSYIKRNCKTKEELPKEAREYVDFIEKIKKLIEHIAKKQKKNSMIHHQKSSITLNHENMTMMS